MKNIERFILKIPEQPNAAIELKYDRQEDITIEQAIRAKVTLGAQGEVPELSIEISRDIIISFDPPNIVIELGPSIGMYHLTELLAELQRRRENARDSKL